MSIWLRKATRSVSWLQGCKIRSGRGRIIRIFVIGIRSEFCQKSSKFCSHSWNRSGKTPNSVGIRQKSRNLTNSQHSLQNLAKFREKFIRMISILAKSDENCEKYQNFGRNFENYKNFPTNIC